MFPHSLACGALSPVDPSHFAYLHGKGVHIFIHKLSHFGGLLNEHLVRDGVNQLTGFDKWMINALRSVIQLRMLLAFLHSLTDGRPCEPWRFSALDVILYQVMKTSGYLIEFGNDQLPRHIP